MQHGLDQHMLQDDAFAWQALAAHFGSDRVNAVASSRRRFAAHLRPDLQAAIIAALTPLSPSLHGVHQGHEFAPLTDLAALDPRRARCRRDHAASRPGHRHR